MKKNKKSGSKKNTPKKQATEEKLTSVEVTGSDHPDKIPDADTTISDHPDRKVLTAGTTGFEFDTDFTGVKPEVIKDGPELLFDGFEVEKRPEYKDERYEADSVFGVRESARSKEDLDSLWKQKNDQLRQSIATNEKQLLFVKKRIEQLKFALVFHIVLFIVCVLVNVLLWIMKNAIWQAFQPTYVGVLLVMTGVVSFYNVFATGKSIRQYRYHIVRDAGWTKPPVVDPLHRKRPGRERNFKAEYEKVNWVLRQYDYEKELMFVIKMHIDSGELTDVEELRRQLMDVFIFEEVVPAMR